MAEIVAESLICKGCGADIRGGSLFCYNCGQTIADVPDGGAVEQNLDANAISKNGSTDEPAKTEKLRSAASLRKRAKVFNRQPVEYVWEKRTGPSVGFVISAIVLSVLAGILLFLALYLR